MKILILGSGGREHALIWKLSYSPHRPRIYAAPGNPGVSNLATLVPIAVDDLEGICRFASSEKIDLVISGPEGPLVAGIADKLHEVGIPCLGPSRLPAMLEGSKAYAKLVMDQYEIPTAPYAVVRTVEDGMSHIEARARPVVLKADGLCGGKGVFLPENEEEAREHLVDLIERRRFGAAGSTVIVEDRLEGTEVSLICVCDGRTAIPLEGARDYKRAYDGDEGPNTGGMGCVSPNPVLTLQQRDAVMDTVVHPLLEGLVESRTPYRGILYVGLMMTALGPRVLEFNVRFGDPETQAILPRLTSDLLDLLIAACEQRLEGTRLLWDRRPSVCVVLAGEDYPAGPTHGRPIEGLEGIGSADVLVTHAGTRLEDGTLVTSGGRILGVTSLAPDMEQARARTYETIGNIRFEGMRFRTDIGKEISSP